MKKLIILSIILMIAIMGCQSHPESTIIPSVVPVPQTVPPSLENEVFPDGVFYPTPDHMKLNLYMNDLLEEIRLLRIELEKFESDDPNDYTMIRKKREKARLS